MGRSRGPKFYFPLPGRKSHSKKADKNNDLASPISSIPSIPSANEWAPRYEEPSSYSKAQRVLGTAAPPFRPSSRQASIPPSPGYMTITVSEAGSDFDDMTSFNTMEPPRRPNTSNRASSNILPAASAYNGEDRRGSNCSSVSRQLHPSTSNTTMRSHYDSQSSPLSISQQTSNSAVRDMALRRGKPQIATTGHDCHVGSPLAHQLTREEKKEQRKSKPARLDLSKLFPKPKGHGDQEHVRALLSPNKLVNSPSAMSTASDYFPRPMTREPTPTPRGQAKLTKPAKRQQAPPIQPHQATSPTRLHKRDMYDNAKINVRRPPRGIQHWFEGLDEDSDDVEDEPTTVHAPKPVKPTGQHLAQHLAPVRKSSLGRLLQDNPSSKQPVPRASQHIPDPRKATYPHGNSSVAHRLNSPSQASLSTTRTKESALSRTNLQNSSVLSFSSSEDEDEHAPPTRSKVAVRDSIDVSDDQGDIVIGRARAFEIPHRNSRRPSTSKLSLLSTSTNAATIEVMYTPEPYASQHFPRNILSGQSSRRSSHMRQPSVIPEDEGARPKTAASGPMSPSVHSVRTSVSEPHPESHKLMAVTAEEEALLEMMRKKRAAMVQQSWTEGYQTAIKQEEVRQVTPPENNKKAHRTSGFLSLESPSASPVRVVETKKSTRKFLAISPSPLLVPPPSRGRPVKAAHDALAGTSILRDSSSCDPIRHESPLSQATLAHRLSPPPEFSPLDPFSSPTVASPTTTDHASPLPSPVTPRLRHGEADVAVKVATSEPSCSGDNDDLSVLETGIIDPPSGSIKPQEQHNAYHQRRRTASSGADVPFPTLPKSKSREHHDLAPVSEASSRTPSLAESIPTQPVLPVRSPRRTNALSVSTTGLPKNKRSSIVSTRTTSPLYGSQDRRSSRTTSRVGSIASMKRESVTVGSAATRCSVSEDVLAAWGSLGGLRDYDTARY